LKTLDREKVASELEKLAPSLVEVVLRVIDEELGS